MFHVTVRLAGDPGGRVQFEEVLRRLVRVVPRNEPREHGFRARGFEEIEHLGVDPSVPRVEVRHGRVRAGRGAKRADERGERRDVRLAELGSTGDPR